MEIKEYSYTPPTRGDASPLLFGNSPSYPPLPDSPEYIPPLPEEDLPLPPPLPDSPRTPPLPEDVDLSSTPPLPPKDDVPETPPLPDQDAPATPPIPDDDIPATPPLPDDYFSLINERSNTPPLPGAGVDVLGKISSSLGPCNPDDLNRLTPPPVGSSSTSSRIGSAPKVISAEPMTVWKGIIHMPDVAKFSASAFEVSWRRLPISGTAKVIESFLELECLLLWFCTL